MPPEWYEHSASWLAWPHNRDTWPTNLVDAQSEWADLCNAIADDEKVYVAIRGDHRDHLINVVGRRSEIELVDIPTNDAWIRDHGPTFVTVNNSKSAAAISWNYNCWGQKYPPFDCDEKVAARIAEHTQTDFVTASFTGEGGAIEVNGIGDLLTTKSCLLNQNRNPGITPEEIEAQLRRLCGVERVWWYEGPDVPGDDTDGHIDQQARFVNQSTVLVNAGIQSDQKVRHLFNSSDAAADPKFNVETVPQPESRIMFQRTIPASYLNFYITRRSVIVPQFYDSFDETAAKVVSEFFPDRKLIRLASLNLSFGLGSFHCLTQQQV